MTALCQYASQSPRPGGPVEQRLLRRRRLRRRPPTRRRRGRWLTAVVGSLSAAGVWELVSALPHQRECLSGQMGGRGCWSADRNGAHGRMLSEHPTLPPLLTWLPACLQSLSTEPLPPPPPPPKDPTPEPTPEPTPGPTGMGEGEGGTREASPAAAVTFQQEPAPPPATPSPLTHYRRGENGLRNCPCARRRPASTGTTGWYCAAGGRACPVRPRRRGGGLAVAHPRL